MNGIGGNIFIGFVIAFCIVGSILGWRIDNCRSPEDKADKQADSSVKEDSDIGEVDE